MTLQQNDVFLTILSTSGRQKVQNIMKSESCKRIVKWT